MMTNNEYWLRSATEADVSTMTALVNAAYGHYVERLGMKPRPMTDDYAEVIQSSSVTVAESHGAIVGVIVLAITDEGFVIDNIAVHPSYRGKGIGKALLEFAEAEALRAGFDSIYLFTHEKMTENQALYSRIGYVEYDRRSQGTFSLVFMSSSIPITSSQRQITVGPMMVRMRDTIVGLPVKACTRPAPIDPLPATAAVQPSQRGKA